MSLKILYFASLREMLGTSGEEMTLPAGVTDVASLRAHLAARGNSWTVLSQSKSVRTAVNQRMADAETAVADGDEVAFFPPVTGG